MESLTNLFEKTVKPLSVTSWKWIKRRSGQSMKKNLLILLLPPKILITDIMLVMGLSAPNLDQHQTLVNKREGVEAQNGNINRQNKRNPTAGNDILF